MSAPKKKAARMLAHPKAAEYQSNSHAQGITSTAPATTCAACREPADAVHGAIVWRLCANCRAMMGCAGALPLIVARIEATIAAQRAQSVRKG